MTTGRSPGVLGILEGRGSVQIPPDIAVPDLDALFGHASRGSAAAQGSVSGQVEFEASPPGGPYRMRVSGVPAGPGGDRTFEPVLTVSDSRARLRIDVDGGVTSLVLAATLAIGAVVCPQSASRGSWREHSP